MNAGLNAVVAARSALGAPPWASALPPCSGGEGDCPVRLELLDVAEALRSELLRALNAQGSSGADACSPADTSVRP